MTDTIRPQAQALIALREQNKATADYELPLDADCTPHAQDVGAF